jgi:hypothetical protein
MNADAHGVREVTKLQWPARGFNREPVKWLLIEPTGVNLKHHHTGSSAVLNALLFSSLSHLRKRILSMSSPMYQFTQRRWHLIQNCFGTDFRQQRFTSRIVDVDNWQLP